MLNAQNLGLANRLRVLRHKLTSESDLIEVEGNLDLIVSNPPYVLREDLKNLEPEISLYEDLRALDGGIDGLDIIRDILKLASQKLRVKGILWLEVDPSHPDKIAKYLEENSELQLKYIASYKYMFERERFVEIKKC
jgi:release factor glutamine methyltransferase